jgi:ArsR family transcriptional regulator
MATDETTTAALAKALAHPARIRILRLLQTTPGCIGGEIVGAVGLAQSTVSEHLRILKAAGVITGEIDAALAPLAELIMGLTPSPNGACCIPGARESA